jgi:Flp pilus assembly protein TadG
MYPNMARALAARFRSLGRNVAHLHKDRAATVSVMFAFSLVAIVPAIGVAVDVSRTVQFRTAMQNAVDNAALAGASAYIAAADSTNGTTAASNYLTKAFAALPGGATDDGAPTITPTASAANSNNGNLIKIQATRSLPMTFLSPLMSAIKVSVTATAQNNPPSTAFVGGTNPPPNTPPLKASSDAGDHNLIYMYQVPADGSAPQASDLKLIYDNHPADASVNQPSVSLTVTAGQKIGFALQNITGGIHAYGTNGYGGATGSTHWIYSHMSPPSKVAYGSSATSSKDCSVLTSDVTKDPVGLSTANAPTTGSCLSSSSSYAQNLSLDCSHNVGKSIRFYWNDMGGTRDDKDFNDAAYTVSCTTPASSSGSSNGSAPKGVVLVK